MVLLLKREKISNNRQITIGFEDSLHTFYDFEQIFKSFRELDSFCERFLISKQYSDYEEIDVHSDVQRISKESPFELTAFIADHWFEIFLFVWGSYDRIRPNAELIFKDLVDFSNTIESKLKDISSEFPELEYRKLEEVLNWFNTLPFIERARIARMMIKQSKIFRKITKIIFGKK